MAVFHHYPDVKSVGVRDGKRADEWPVVIRAVNTVDAMTATVENVPFDLLQHITDRITHEVKGVNRVLYDLTPSPPAPSSGNEKDNARRVLCRAIPQSLRRESMKKRVLAWLMTLCLVLSLLPATALAVDGNWIDSVDTSWYDGQQSPYTISTAAGLAGLAKLVNDGTDNFSGKTIKLAADIDLGGKEWTPIGNPERCSRVSLMVANTPSATCISTKNLPIPLQTAALACSAIQTARRSSKT